MDSFCKRMKLLAVLRTLAVDAPGLDIPRRSYRCGLAVSLEPAN